MKKTTQKKNNSQKKPLLKQFTKVYLETISIHTIHKFSATTLTQFIADRFQYFTQNINPKKTHHFSFQNIEPNTKYPKGKCIFEYIVPDCNYLLATFKALFHKNGIQINQIFHPIFGVKFKNNVIQTILPNEENIQLYATTYLELDYIDNPNILKTIQDCIEYHLRHIQQSHKDKSNILSQIDIVKTHVINTTPATTIPLNEWINLIDWLKNLNFTFFGYIQMNPNNQFNISKV